MAESLTKSSGRACSAWLRLNPEYLPSVIANTPFVLQMLMLVHFTDGLLAKFLREHGHIRRIEKIASEFDLQLFVLDLLTRIEKRGNKDLLHFAVDYKLHLQYGWSTVRVNEENMIRVHWPTKSLGLGYFFPSRLGTHTKESALFLLKFSKPFFDFYPCPALPQSLRHFLPFESDPRFGQCFKLPSKLPHTPRTCKRYVSEEFELERNYSLRERFCSRLCGIYHMLTNEMHHEALVYCFELLEGEKFKSANLHIEMLVWGSLAVILSLYNLSDVCIQSCIYEMQVLSFYESDKFDICWARQQVYANQQKMFKEKQMFELIFDSTLPKSSDFCSNSLLLHLKTRLNLFNNWILEIVVYKKTLTINRRWVRDQIEGRVELANDDIDRLKSTLHKVYSLECKNYTKHYKYFAILDFYQAVFRNCTLPFDIDDIVDYSKILELQFETFCLSSIAQLFNNENNFYPGDYRDRMEEMKVKLERQSHQASSKRWADECFVHFVFLALSDSDPGLVDFMFEEAKEFYCRGAGSGHYRGMLLKDFENCERTGKLSFESQLESRDAAPLKNVTAEVLLRSEPKLKFFLLAGIKMFELNHRFI